MFFVQPPENILNSSLLDSAKKRSEHPTTSIVSVLSSNPNSCSSFQSGNPFQFGFVAGI
jgi:hypothetical protein